MAASVWLYFILSFILESIDCLDLCPDMKFHRKHLNLIDNKIHQFSINRYKFVDPSLIQSVFFFDSESRRENSLTLYLNTLNIIQVCSYSHPRNAFAFNRYNMVDITNISDSRLTLKFHEKSNNTFDVFCGSPDTMNYIYVLDFEPMKFMSLYGCKEIKVNGQWVKHEGVFALQGYGFDSSIDYFKYTRNVLKKHTGIDWESLKEINVNSTKASSCDRIRLKNIRCNSSEFSVPTDNFAVQIEMHFGLPMFVLVVKSLISCLNVKVFFF